MACRRMEQTGMKMKDPPYDEKKYGGSLCVITGK